MKNKSTKLFFQNNKYLKIPNTQLKENFKMNFCQLFNKNILNNLTLMKLYLIIKIMSQMIHHKKNLNMQSNKIFLLLIK